jgi:Carboxypeptidase regulatory-like domain
MRHISARLFFLAMICATLPSLAFAQAGGATAEIKGKITDPNGSVIAGAAVTVTDAEKGISRTATSDEQGEYRLLSLTPGNYNLKVEATGFAQQVYGGLQVTVGQTLEKDFALQVGGASEAITVTDEAPTIETEKTQQSNTINEQAIRNLPIDRRDYLTFTLLAPGVVDSNAMADNTDFRVAQTPQSGISFYGSNGRGNSVTMDGAEANDFSGGVRSTLSQDAVQEFQINRSNYNAELGGASGGVINIVSKTGTNNVRGSVFGFFRNQALDAADPFAIVLDETTNIPRRIKPDANRQQYGGTIGFPIIKDRTFFFGGYEGLRRRESSTVPVLTDLSIFQPTAAQITTINRLASDTSTTPVPCLTGEPNLTPAACAVALQTALTAKPSTQALFRQNSGVFPFTSDSNAFSLRFDHRANDKNQFFLRYNFTDSTEGNQSTRALVGISRSNNVENLDSTIVGGWTHIFSPNLINETRLQWNYRKFDVLPNDPNGPELNVTGFGFFNRDIFLPALIKERRYEIADNLTYVRGAHRLKFGASVLIRHGAFESHTFFGGRFGFSTLPGALLSPQLATTSINQLQSLDLGLPTSYQQGFGDPTVKGTIPFYAFYGQDTWNVRPNLTFNYGLRYEIDDRLDPLPTYKKNFGPRVGFAWDPLNDKKTSVRGGYGIFYSPTYFQIDYVVNALNEIDGFRQIPQILTTFNAANPLAVNGPVNIFRTLRQQGVIGIPDTTRTITPADLTQFGINISQTGPRNPLTVLFRADQNYRNQMAQQASLSFERELAPGLSASASYIWVLTQHATRARDINLLPRPVFPGSGIPEWTARSGCAGAGLANCFREPLLFQEIIYESAASALYHGAIFEVSKRFGGHFAIAGNYTFSRAIDEVTDYNSDFRANDQTNTRLERALSAFDQRHKVVIYAVLQSPYKNRALADFTLTPIFRANSGRPFNLLTGSDVNGDRSTSGDRPPFVGRNTGIGPNFWTFDLRLARRIGLGSEARNLELAFEAFNLFNRLNFASVNNTVGALPPGAAPFGNPDLAATVRVEGRRDRGPSQPLGFTSAFDTRRIQLGLRLRF